MDPLTLIAFGVGLAALACIGLMLHGGFEGSVARRALRRARTTPIAEVQDGTIARITGRVRIEGEPLRAPFTARECAAWTVDVDAKALEHHGPLVQKALRDQDSRSFYVEDETGRALVKAVTPKMALVDDFRVESGRLDPAEAVLEAFLNRHGASAKDVTGRDRELTYQEGVLEEGEEATVLGVAHWQASADAASRRSGFRDPPRLLVIEAPEEAPLFISDDPKVIA